MHGTTIDFTDITASWAGMVFSWIAGVLDGHEFTASVIFTAALLVYLGYLGYFLLRATYRSGKELFKRLIKYKAIRKYLVWPMRRIKERLISKPIRKTRVAVMHKVKKTVVGDRLYDCILKMEIDGILNSKDSKVVQSIIAEGLGLPELLPRKLHRAFLRAYFKGTTDKPPLYEKLAGPRKYPFNLGAGGPPSLHIPPVEKIVWYKLLERIKGRNAA